jgi:hypothetical protein
VTRDEQWNVARDGVSVVWKDRARPLFVRDQRARLMVYFVPAIVRFKNVPWLDFDVIVKVEIIDEDNPRIVLTEHELLRRADGPPVTAASLRALKFSRLRDTAISAVAERARVVDDQIELSGDRVLLDEVAISAATRSLNRRTGRGAVLRQVADAWMKAPVRQKTAAVVALGYSEPHAKRLIAQAREAELLPHSARSQPKPKSNRSRRDQP